MISTLNTKETVTNDTNLSRLKKFPSSINVFRIILQLNNLPSQKYFLVSFLLEPSKAPEHVTTKQSGATSITVTWDPVPLSGRNGNITGYTVYYRAVSGHIVNNNELMIKVNASVLTLDLSNLEEYVTYNVSVSANTSVGEGPRSKGAVQKTAEASEY